jgi:hypothetical protein
MAVLSLSVPWVRRLLTPDLNDYAFFVEVVTYGGFAAAGRALRAPKSTLSRRIAGLEARLGVRLIERSTRRFRVTEVGQAFYERCRTIVMDVRQADAVVSEALGEPRGVVRCSCPLGFVEAADLLQFHEEFPEGEVTGRSCRPCGGPHRRADRRRGPGQSGARDRCRPDHAHLGTLQPNSGRRASPGGVLCQRRHRSALRSSDAGHHRPDG